MAFRQRCQAARRIMQAAVAQPMYHPITTDFVRSVDRISHKLLLEFTLGLDSNIISMTHEDNDEIDLDKCIDQNEKIIDFDDADGLNDVLNDFEEIRNSLNDHDLNFNEFCDISGNDVDGVLSEKEINNDFDELIRKGLSSKSIDSEIEDMLNAELKRDDCMSFKAIDESTNLTPAKHMLNVDTSNTFNNAEELLNANINESLTEVMNLNEVSINTNDLNDNDTSNLVDTFDNFILDNDYMNDKFLIESNMSEVLGKEAMSDSNHEDMLRNIIPTICKSSHIVGYPEINNIPITGKKEIQDVKDSLIKEIASMGEELKNIGKQALLDEIILKACHDEKNVRVKALIKEIPPMGKDVNIGKLPSVTEIPSMGKEIINIRKVPSLKEIPSMGKEIIKIGEVPSLTEIPSMGKEIINFAKLPSLAEIPAKGKEIINIGEVTSLTEIPSMGKEIINFAKLPSLAEIPSMGKGIINIGEVPSLTEIPSMGKELINFGKLPSIAEIPPMGKKAIDIGDLSSLTDIPSMGKEIINIGELPSVTEIPPMGKKMINIGKQSSITENPSMGKEIINIGELPSVTEIPPMGKKIINIDKLPLTEIAAMGKTMVDIGELSSLTEIPSMGKELENIREKSLLKEMIPEASEKEKSVDIESFIKEIPRTRETDNIDVEFLLKDNPKTVKKKKKASRTIRKVTKPLMTKTNEMALMKENNLVRKAIKKIQPNDVLTDELTEQENNNIEWQKSTIKYEKKDIFDDDELELYKPKMTKKYKIPIIKDNKPLEPKIQVARKSRKKLLEPDEIVTDELAIDFAQPETYNIIWQKGMIKYKKVDDEKSNSENTKPAHEFIKFGDDFNFKVFVLTREEQMQDLQMKRETPLYVASPYKCEKCVKGFRSEITLRNHMKCHQVEYGKFECEICFTRHKCDSRRRRHADKHRLRYCCTRCEFVARSRDIAESHFHSHVGKTFECPFCGELFNKRATQLSHVRLHHPNMCTSCEQCGEAFVSAYGLQLHTKRAHGGLEPPKPEEMESFCYSCRFQFSNQDAFSRHRALAGNSCCLDLCPCAECGDSFESEAALRQHARDIHAEAPIKCQKCDALFANATSRQTHYERVHLRVRVKIRRGPINPTERVRSTAKKPFGESEKVMCEVCGNKYHSQAALFYHQRTHEGQRPFKCARCTKAFPFKHSLLAHLRIHTGERPFRCALCPRTFLNANNLSRHKKTQHGAAGPARRVAPRHELIAN